ncbi:hypothetical protein SAY87_030295 [Trapa incisa]|uniref:Uncharacterized protein n=2 Tax=Trapa TaxID=22665 RepID=A0AAN7R297_TRANT|nr:hypothetical protein SAY87_030295 [Trapa incisa]KAK4787067.1 hypothetical protein SAY86_010900 [Trapa natans]
MAMEYMDEDEAWKCMKHPSRRRRKGICPTCLKERLSNLCPDCAETRPCGCGPSTTSSSSSPPSSSLSRFFPGGRSVGHGSNLNEPEPSLRRVRSVAVSLFRSRSRYANDLDAGQRRNGEPGSEGGKGSRTAFLWGMFKRDKSKRSGGGLEEAVQCAEDESRRAEDERRDAAEDRSMMMRKSRSVAVTSNYTGFDGRSAATGKRRGWYFPSPMKAFRQSKAVVAQEG